MLRRGNQGVSRISLRWIPTVTLFPRNDIRGNVNRVWVSHPRNSDIGLAQKVILRRRLSYGIFHILYINRPKTQYLDEEREKAPCMTTLIY